MFTALWSHRAHRQTRSLDPQGRGSLVLRAADRARCEGRAGRARAGLLPEDVGCDRAAHLSPIRPELPFPAVRDFAKALAKEVEKRIGELAGDLADAVGLQSD